MNKFLGNVLLILLLMSGVVFGQIPKKIEVAKSPKKAFAMSVVLPGAGQFYSKSPIAGIIYGAVEIAGITSAIIFTNRGNDGVVEYENFADNNWNLIDFMEGYDGIEKSHEMMVVIDGKRYGVRDDWNGLSNDYANGYTEIRVEKDYHFYENIGKYKQFQTGWVDYGDSLGFENIYRSSPIQVEYSHDRYLTNQFFQSATYAVTTVMFNHIISAIDGAIRTKKYNENNALTLEIHATPLVYEDKGAMLNLQISW